MPHHPDCPQMGQLHTNGTFMDLGCVVGGGELRSASCSPHWWAEYITNCKRERGHSHSLSQGQGEAMPSSLSSKPL